MTIINNEAVDTIYAAIEAAMDYERKGDTSAAILYLDDAAITIRKMQAKFRGDT